MPRLNVVTTLIFPFSNCFSSFVMCSWVPCLWVARHFWTLHSVSSMYSHSTDCASGNDNSDVPMNLKSYANSRFMFKGTESYSEAVHWDLAGSKQNVSRLSLLEPEIFRYAVVASSSFWLLMHFLCCSKEYFSDLCLHDLNACVVS